MVSVATDRKLAWIVLAIIGFTALIGFGNGLRSALAAPRAALPGETAAALLAAGASSAPRDATAEAAMDEARVHEIAREEADAALARAKPAAPRKPRAAPAAAADATPDQPIPYTPSAGADAGPATPQNPPSNPDQG